MRLGVALSLALLASPLLAQESPAVALATDVAVALPVGQFADDGADPGWSITLTPSVRLTRLFGVYGLYEKTSFPVERPESDEADGRWTDTGFGFGGRLWIPVRDRSRIQPWIQLGLGWHDLDSPIAGDDFSGLDTEGLRTIEGGAGLDIAFLGQTVFFRPVVRYRRYSFEVDTGNETLSNDISYFAAGVGILVAWNLGRPDSPSP